MYTYILNSLSLSQLNDNELAFLAVFVFIICLIIGMLMDIILRQSAFGIIGNAVILFICYISGLLIYHSYVQNLRQTGFIFSTASAVSFAFFMLLRLALLKNRVVHS